MKKERIQMSIQTVKEDIDILESIEFEDVGYYLQLEHEKFVLEALEKQMPKKPVIPFDSINREYECPKCPHRVYKTQQYCDKCGQALDWSEEE